MEDCREGRAAGAIGVRPKYNNFYRRTRGRKRQKQPLKAYEALKAVGQDQ